MPDPFRLIVLKNLCAALGTITVANGYTHDVGPDRVFRGRTEFGENDPIPLISVLEAPVPEETYEATGPSTQSVNDWELLVQGFVKDDPMHPTDPAHFLLADVKKCLAAERAKARTYRILDIPNGRVDKLSIGSGVVRPADEISVYAYFWLGIRLKICEDNLNPYW